MTRAMIVIAALAAPWAFLGACTEVPDLPSNTCGNRIVEESEDCDGRTDEGLLCGEPETANECRLVCDASAAEPACPVGWGCGRDGRCRRPTGALQEAPGSPVRLAVEEGFVVGDIDGDGYPDLVGNQASRISMRFGSGLGDFPTALDVVVPVPTSLMAFDDLSDDGLLDVLVPITGALFTMLGSPGQQLDPVAYGTLPLVPGGRIRVLAVDAFTNQDDPGDRDLEILALLEDGMAFFEAESSSRASFPGEGFPALDIGVGNIDNDQKTEVVLGFPGESVIHICEGRISGEGEKSLQPVCDGTVALTSPVHADIGGTAIIDVDGDGTLDILAAVDTGGEAQVEVAFNDGLGNFTAATVIPFFSTTLGDDAMVARANPWPLASADFDRDGNTDYVFSQEIVLSRDVVDGIPQTPEVLVQAASGPWLEATVSDINGDQRPDVAVNRGKLTGVDVFLNADDVILGPSFNKFNVATEGPPAFLSAGDFDGDLVGDIAFVEDGLGEVPDRVSVVYGNASGTPLPPITMGSFGKVDVLEPLVTELGVSDFDIITDLAVVFSVSAGNSRSASLLRGDSSRRMLSPFFLLNEDEELDTPRGVIAGDFALGSQGAPTPRDALVISEYGGELGMWLLDGGVVEGGLVGPGIPDRSLLEPTRGMFDYVCALWAAGDIDPGTPGDELVGIDQLAGCDSSESAGPGASLFQMDNVEKALDGQVSDDYELTVAEIGGGLTGVRSMALHDLNRDGLLDLLAVFTASADSAAGSAIVVFWNQDGRLDPQGTVIQGQGGIQLYDAAPIQLTGDQVPELAVLVREPDVGGQAPESLFKVYWASYDAAGQSYGTLSLLLEAGSDGRLRTTDVNADGIDDLVFTAGANVRTFLQEPGAPLGSGETGEKAGAP